MKIDSNLIVFITGASNGFGFQIAQDLLEQNVKCYLTDIQDNAKQLQEKYGEQQCVFRHLDITDEENVKKCFEDCVNKFQDLHVCVNSAGISGSQMSIISPENTPEKLMEILKVNVIGTFIVNKYSSLQMVKLQQKNDRERLIINFGSVASTHSNTGMINYGASKGAVLGMTLPLARDLGKYKVRVVCFTPGIFLTNMGYQFPTKLLNLIAKTTALGRHGQSKELSLATQGVIQSSYQTGTFFHIDSTIASPHF